MGKCTPKEREIEMKRNTDRINLRWELDGDQYEMFFGYLDDSPTYALFKNNDEEPTMIPKDVVLTALEMGSN